MALHAGATAALLIAWRQASPYDLAPLDAPAVRVLAVATAPAALAGYLLQDRIELRLGRPPAIAAGLLLGALAMGLSDRRPERRRVDDATLADAVWIGVAQASALVPGVSRSGATLSAARFRHFRRADAAVLSRRLAFPVTTGATVLAGWRLARRGVDAGSRLPLAAGVASSFVSTLIAARLLPAPGERPLWPYAVYRAVLAGAILARLGRSASPSLGGDAHEQGPAGSV